MLRIKKLDIFVLKSFCMLFMGTFFICLFIFMMQFLWRYVDEMVGKGLEMTVLAQFFFYSALSLVPASLPLAILLAALITFGNFGERFELLAMKAAGISLLKIMRPLIIFICFICCVSFYFQNVIGPKAQTKLWTLLISMKQKSPEVDIPEGVFYDEIDGYNLYVKHKNRKTGMLYDVLIYNFEKGFENAQIIKSDSGRLEMTADKQHLYLHLYSGEQFENLKSQNMNQRNVPYRRETFREKHAIIEFNSDFNMVDAGIMSNQSNSKDMRMLQADIDSMKLQNDSVGRGYYKEAMAGTYKVTAKKLGATNLVITDQAGEKLTLPVSVNPVAADIGGDRYFYMDVKNLNHRIPELGLQHLSQVTYEIIFYPNDTRGLQTFMGLEGNLLLRSEEGRDTNPHFQIAFKANGLSNPYLLSEQVVYSDRKDANAKKPGKWYHVALVYDGTQPNIMEAYKLYINGVPEKLTGKEDYSNKAPNSSMDLTIMNADNYFMIGRANNNDYRNGLIRVYQARIWKTARTEQEIKENLCELKSGYNTDDLVGYWIFSDGIEKSEYEDLSGHEMNAKVGDHNGAKPSTIAADRYKPVECPHSY